MKSMVGCLLGLLLSTQGLGQIITTVAGTPGVRGYSGDYGPATAAILQGSVGLTTDRAGNWYVSDIFSIRRIDAGGTITTIAGNGGTPSGFDSGNGGAATAVALLAYSLSTDKVGNVYFASGGSVRKVSTAGILSTVAGVGRPHTGITNLSGTATATPIHHPTSIYADTDGRVFFVDSNYIMMIDTFGMLHHFAGNGLTAYSGDGAPATAAGMAPIGITGDAAGNVYVSDRSNRISMITPLGIIHILAGNGVAGHSGDGGPATAASLSTALGADLAVDQQGDVSFSEFLGHDVRKILMGPGIITTLAGTGARGFSGDGGPATAAQLNSPTDVQYMPDGSLLIADFYNFCVRKVASPPAGVSITPFSGAFTIYPIPCCNGHLFIENTLPISGSYQVSLLSLNGRILQSSSSADGHVCELYFSGKGAYVLRIEGYSVSEVRMVEFR